KNSRDVSVAPRKLPPARAWRLTRSGARPCARADRPAARRAAARPGRPRAPPRRRGTGPPRPVRDRPAREPRPRARARALREQPLGLLAWRRDLARLDPAVDRERDGADAARRL